MKVSPDEQKLYSGESELTQKESNMEGEIYPCGGVGEFLISMFELYYTNIFLFLILQPSSSHPRARVLCSATSLSVSSMWVAKKRAVDVSIAV